MVLQLSVYIITVLRQHNKTDMDFMDMSLQEKGLCAPLPAS